MSTVPEEETYHVPDDVRDFAERQNIAYLLPTVTGLAQRLFPGLPLHFSLDVDPEIEGLYTIQLTVPRVTMTAEESQRASDDWHLGLIDAIGGHDACNFRLDLDLI